MMHTFNPSTRTAWSVHSEFLASQGSLVRPNCLLTAYTMDPELGFSDSLNGCWFNYLVNLGSCHSGPDLRPLALEERRAQQAPGTRRRRLPGAMTLSRDSDLPQPPTRSRPRTPRPAPRSRTSCPPGAPRPGRRQARRAGKRGH